MYIRCTQQTAWRSASWSWRHGALRLCLWEEAGTHALRACCLSLCTCLITSTPLPPPALLPCAVPCPLCSKRKLEELVTRHLGRARGVSDEDIKSSVLHGGPLFF